MGLVSCYVNGRTYECMLVGVASETDPEVRLRSDGPTERNAVITCDECGRENDDDYKYCLGCGAALQEGSQEESEEEDSEIINCPYCGAEQPSNFKFCGSCGEKIPESSAAETQQESEPEPEPEENFDEAVSTSPGKPGGDGDGAAATVDTADSTPRTPEQDQPAEAGTQDTDGRSDTPRGGKPAQSGAEERPEAGASAAAQLVVIRPDGTEGASIDVPEDKLTIGRDSEIEALSDDPFLSPEHASFLFDEGGFVIRDEESLNGIFREVTDEIELQNGDLIRIGQELIRFEYYDEEPGEEDAETLTAGSPNPGYWGRLTLIAGPEVYTEAYALGGSEVTVGRETGDIVFRDDGFVSGTHARVANRNGAAVLEDLNSSNGTFIRIRDDYRLEDGERVLMGQQLFRLEVQ